MPNPAAVSDDLDSFMAARRTQGVSQSSDEDSGNDLDSWMKARRASSESANESAPKTPVIPFTAAVPRTPPTTAAAQVGQPMIRLTPPAMDTTQVPLNVFTGGPQEPGMRTQEEIAQEGTISPSPQTVGTRVARALGSGAPQGSELANLTGERGTTGDIGPRVQNLMTESEQQQHPILTGGGEFASGMLTPESILLLAGTGVAGRFAGPAARTVKQLLAAGFSAQMISDAASKVPDISAAIQRGDWYNAKRLMTHAVLGASMAGLAAHGMFDEPLPTEVPKGTVSGPLAVDRAGAIYDDLQKQSRINAPVRVPPTTEPPTILQGPTQGPQPNPLETEAAQVREQQGNERADAQAKNPPAFTVRDSRRVQPAGPEELPGQTGASKPQPSASPLSPQVTFATLKAQTDALAKGTNPVVYFPKGTENIPAPPENSQVTVVPGDQAGAGTYYHTADVTPEQIHSAVSDGSFGKLLGYQQSKEEAFGGRAPAAITARDANGTEVKAALADVSNPQVVAAQAAEFARRFPDAKIGVENAESVVRERLGKTPEQIAPSHQATTSRETPEAQTPTATAGAVPGDLRPVIENRAIDSFVLARRLQRVDPDLANGLTDIADGELHAPADLQKFVNESVHDPKAKADLTKIVDDYRAASSGQTRGVPRTAPGTAAPVDMRPVIAKHAQQFKAEAAGLSEIDPKLAEGLRGLASGKYHTLDHLKNFVQERITDANTKADLTKIVSGEGAASVTAKPGNTAAPIPSGTSVRQVRGSTASVRENAAQARNKLAAPTLETAKATLDESLKPWEQRLAEKRESLQATIDNPATTPEAGTAAEEEMRQLHGQRRKENIGPPEGETERRAPANAKPQRELLSEERKPKVGDTVSISDGPLKGSTAEVTNVTQEGGVYVRGDENSRVRYVKAGDFEVQTKPSFKTGALDDLVNPNDEGFSGTRYSGLSPAALKKLLPESAREKLDTEVEANQRARGLQGQLYDLESKNAADVLRARNVLREAPGTPADMEAIYHHLEDPDIRLSSEQRKILDGYLRPMLDESERINEKLEGREVENYVHRIPVGKGSLLDRILGGESNLSAGRGLSKSAGSLKGRTMMALEDEAGDRQVISIKDGKVTAFDHGQAEDLGRIRGLETQGIKSRGAVLDRQLEPMQRELDRLETERRTLTATKGREASARRRIENIENRQAELREALQDAYRTNEGHLLSENDLRGRVFVDKNGKQWKIGQATTKEIEANTGVKYYKNALASTVLNYLQLRRAERAYDFLESYKNSPEFQEVATKMNGRNVPAGWRPTELPQFHGYAFEPHTAEVLDWYAKRMRAGGPNIYRQIGNFLRTAIFFNPLIHTPNISVHWIVEKGLTGFGPQNWGRILRTGSRAIDAVIHQNGDFLSALDAGAPLQSARLDTGATTKLLLQRMGRELETNPTAAQKVASALGYMNPAKLVRAVYNFSGKVTWVSNDIAMLQATYEHMEKTGSPFKEAIADVSKHIPDYRLPTRIFNSTALAKLMSSPDLTMFGAYHYGALRSYGEMAKGLLSEDMPQAERMKSLDRMAMLGLFTFVAYPALDQLAKYLTGDKSAQFRRAGASTFIYNLAQLAQGEKSPTQVLESVATPAVHTKALLQLALNRDFFTGRHIVDWNAPAKTIAAQLARIGGQNLAPVNQGMQVAERRRTLGQQAAGLVGIRTNVPTPAEALARKFAAESAGSAALDEDTLERSYSRRQYENDLRAKKITPRDLGAARAAGTITGQDVKTILQRAALTPLQNEFKGLPIEKALQVWQKADGQERKSLRAFLVAKAERINSSGYNPAQFRNLIGRVRSALAGSVPTTPPNGTTGVAGRRAPAN